ncbi:MAG TPA: hypothetical protein VK154_10590 [Chitinophagales bacterium]|nr:hypothetical protein [Chitinophagales bacterium]
MNKANRSYNRLNNAITFTGGLVFSLVINGCCYFILFIKYFDLFGYDEITRPEERDFAILLSLIAILTGTIAIALLLRRTDKKYAGIGFYLPSAVTWVLLLFIYLPRYVVKSNYYQPFNKQIWMEERPIKMSRQIVKDKTLVGKTRAHVEARLGKASKNYQQGYTGAVSQYTDKNNFTYLSIVYSNNIVAEVYVGCYCD